MWYSSTTTDPLIELSVHSHYEDEGSMWAAQWSQQKEASEVGVVLMATAVIDPWTVVIHFHHTPNIFNMGLKKSDYTNLIQNNRTCWLLYIPGFLWFVCVVRKQRILCDNAKRVYTCYTCDNDETLVPWAPGTPNSTVNTEFPLDSSVIKETLTVQMIDLTCFLCF